MNHNEVIFNFLPPPHLKNRVEDFDECFSYLVKATIYFTITLLESKQTASETAPKPTASKTRTYSCTLAKILLLLLLIYIIILIVSHSLTCMILAVTARHSHHQQILQTASLFYFQIKTLQGNSWVIARAVTLERALTW